MARPKLGPHLGHDLSVVDTLELWKLDESSSSAAAAAEQDSARDLAIYTSSSATPTKQPSLFESDSVLGSREFDGTCCFLNASPASNDDVNDFLWDWGQGRDPLTASDEARSPGITVEAWVRPTNLSSEVCIVELGAFHVDESTNPMASLRITTAGELTMKWRRLVGGSTVVSTSSGAGILVDTTYHVAAVIDDDPNNHDKRVVRFYVDGEFISETEQRNLPTTGGTNAQRWLIGGSLMDGSGVSTPGALFVGRIDDVRVSRFAATSECVRYDYARGKRDFDETELASCPFTEHHARVEIMDFWGTVEEGPGERRFVDLADLMGHSWLLEASIDEDTDNQASTASVKLVGHIGEAALSALAKDYTFQPSGVEQYSNPLSDSDHGLLGPMRRVKISVATVPWGTGREGAAPYFQIYFDGFVKAPTSSDSGDSVSLACIDKGAALQDVWVEPDEYGRERSYPSSGTSGEAIEAQIDALISDNDPALYIVPTVHRDGTSFFLEITVLDTTVSAVSDGTSPGRGRPHLIVVGDKFKLIGTVGWDAVYTVDTVTDSGGPTGRTYKITTVETVLAGSDETDIQLLLLPEKSYLGGRPFLWIPDDLDTDIYPRPAPATASVLTTLEEMTSQFAIRCAYMFDPHRQEYRLKAYRSDTTASAGTLFAARMLSAPSVAIDGMRPRTIVVTEFPDDASGSPAGNEGERLRRIAVETAPDQALEVGRRYARVGVGSATNINSEKEGAALSSGILDDIKEAIADTESEMLFNAWAEVGDTALFDGEIASSAVVGPLRARLARLISVGQTLGIVSKRTDLRGGSAYSKVKLRSASTSTRVDRHFDLFQADGFVRGRGTRPPPKAIDPTLTGLKLDLVRGIHVRFERPVNTFNQKWDRMQVHVSGTMGFTPDASSCVGSTPSTSYSHIDAGLVAGNTYYVRIVPVDRMGNYGEASDEVSVVVPA